MLSAADRALLLALPPLWGLATWAWARRVARRTGRPPVARGTRLERAFAPLWLAWLLAPMLAALAPAPCALGCWAGPGDLRGLAWALEALGFGLAAWASRALGASWRVGVDEAGPGPLVARGPYARMRNPIFSAMLLALLGIAVLVPALPLAALGGLSAGVLHAQARREERFLAARHGAAYEDYRARTGRWLPALRARTVDGAAHQARGRRHGP